MGSVMPFVVYVLGVAVFAQGTSEFMLSGLVSDIARDLRVSIAAAGLLTSGFAVGMVIGAPLMALWCRNRSPRAALSGFLAVFAAVHVVGALTSSYPVLLVSRVVAALANAGFWAVALGTAASVVGPEKRARAMAVVVGGVTVACVAGVPAGALLGGWWGWRSAFWAVALVSVPALIAIAYTIPGGRPTPSGSGGWAEMRVLGRRGLPTTLVVMALLQAATFCVFAYLEPLATRVSGFDAGWVPALLAVFGAGSFVGVTIAGRLGGVRPYAVIGCGMLALFAGWAALASLAANPVATTTLVFAQGLFAFGTGTLLITRVLDLAAGAPTLAGAFATAAFNVGGALGPWLGGLGIDAGAGYRSPVWVGVALMGAALAGFGFLVLLRRSDIATAQVPVG